MPPAMSTSTSFASARNAVSPAPRKATSSAKTSNGRSLPASSKLQTKSGAFRQDGLQPVKPPKAAAHLSQHFLHHRAAHVRQPEVPPLIHVRQLQMIDAEASQDGGLQ